MKWEEIGAFLAQAGLTGLGTVFGGPLGGTIGAALGKEIAGVLGVEATPEAVVERVQADPAAAADLLKAEEAKASAAVAMYEAEVRDRVSARDMQVRLTEAKSGAEWTPTILSFIAILAFIAFIAALFLVRVDIPDRLYQLLTVGFGTMSTLLGMTWNFWFGSSRGSQRNGDANRQIAASLPETIGRLAGEVVGKAVRAR